MNSFTIWLLLCVLAAIMLLVKAKFFPPKPTKPREIVSVNEDTLDLVARRLREAKDTNT